MKRFSTFLTTTLAIIGIAALVPATAHAKGSSISIHTKNISIGLHDVGYRNNYRSSKRYNNRRSNRNSYYNYRGNRYNNSYNYNRSYNRGYSNGYNNSYNYYNSGRSSNYCPNQGYSRYDYDNRNCSRHGDHYHCN